MEIQKNFFSGTTFLQSVIELPDNFNQLESKLPIIVLCHGHSRHKNDGLDSLSRDLVNSGFATMRFDFRGCGQNAANRYHLYCATEWVDDLQNALSFAETIPFIDKTRIGIAGISMGAATAIYVGGIDMRIKSIVSMGGISDCKNWLQGVWERSGGDWQQFQEKISADHLKLSATGESTIINVLQMYNSTLAEQNEVIQESLFEPDVNCYLSMDSLFNLLKYRPIEKCSSINNPVFFAHGEDDTLVPISESQTMYDEISSKKKQLKVYKGVDHNIPRAIGRERVFKDIVQWFLDSL